MLESHVFPAYAHLIETLSSLKGSGTNPWGLAHYPEGRAYYQALVDAVVGSGRTLPEIRDLIDRQLLSDVRQMAALVKRRPELLTDISRTIEIQEPEQILEELQTRMQTDFPAAASYAHNGADADGTDHAIHISVKSVSCLLYTSTWNCSFAKSSKVISAFGSMSMTSAASSFASSG